MAAGRRVALLFPGQGAQHIRMATGLYGHEPVFTAAVDDVFAAIGGTGPRLREDWLASRPAVPIDHVTRSTPLLFAVGYALGRLVESWGVAPAAVLGHSVGEMVAATLAERVRILATAPDGGMLAVAASPPQLTGYLGDDLVVGAYNAPGQTVLSGLARSIEQVGRRLRADGFVCRRVPATSPFHSPVMAGLAALEAPAFAGVTLRPPALPVYSAYTGGPLADSVAVDPDFWTGHPAAPVLFWPALDALLASGGYLLVEAGPGAGLSTLARRHPAVASGASEVVAMLGPPPVGAGDDLRSVRAAAARIARTAPDRLSSRARAAGPRLAVQETTRTGE
jgi:[acyl-carrier-protein] S-malonyltransferase